MADPSHHFLTYDHRARHTWAMTRARLFERCITSLRKELAMFAEGQLPVTQVAESVKVLRDHLDRVQAECETIDAARDGKAPADAVQIRW